MKLLLKILLAFCPLIAFGQNLILNPSLEEYWDCPDFPNQLYKAKYWYSPGNPPGQPLQPAPNDKSTSEYFSNCSITFGFTVPNSTYGYQNPKNGNAFCGAFLLANNSSGTKEYITATITSPLIAGKNYCFSFYTSLANNASSYAVDNIGAYFTVDSAYITIPYLSVQPQVVSPNGVFMSDTTDNWMKVEGEFIAQGGEKYVTLGNFNSNSETDYLQLDTINNIPINCYYFFDMLDLHECKGVGIEENEVNKIINIFPNPAIGNVTVAILGELNNARIELYDAVGKLVYNNSLTNNTATHTLPALSNGIYTVAVWNNNTLLKQQKLVVVN